MALDDDEPPGGMPVKMLSDIEMIPGPEFMHMKLWLRDPHSQRRVLQDHYAMTHDDFWRCFRAKQDQFGMPPK